MRKLISIALSLLLCVSCSYESELLRESLKAAGDNRAELEAVLEHYRTVDKDPEKLAAATYLIINMLPHYSYRDTAAINSYYRDALDILGTGPSVDWQRDTLRQIGDTEYPWLSMDIIQDVKVITSDFLIHNIDHAFNQWRTRPWAKHLTYEEFRDWILPYKVTELQSFDEWRDILSEYYSDSINKVPESDVERNSVYGAIEIVRNEIHTKQSDMGFKIFWEDRGCLPLLSAETWTRMTLGSCWDFVNMGISVFRSLGLPASLDYVPLWGRNSNGHSWYVFPSDRGREEVTINSLIMSAGMQFYPYERIPKVFRDSYEINRRLYEYSKKAKYVYPFDLCVKDVTDHYNLTSNIDIDVFDRIRLKDKYVYIAMFSPMSDDSWKILDFGIMKHGKAHFQNMGRNMMYIAMGYNGKNIVPISNPFILHDNGNIEYIVFDDSEYRSITVKRKYYESYNVVDMRRRLLGGKIQCSNRADFSDAVTLFTIESTDIPDKIKIATTNKFRYWRYLSLDGSYGSVAEVAFFDQDGEELTGRGIANPEADKETIARAFDGDWLTNFETDQPDGNWIGLDLYTPQTVSSVRIVPRSDDNDVHPGQEYELRYLNARGRWKSLGKRIAEENYLEYDSVPGKCLLWLLNHTCGSDERPFVYDENNALQWW